MASISNYTGDANLGIGTNPNIPAINPNANLNVINETGKNIMLLNHENNVNLYRQKIKDRDSLYELLDAGKVAVGDILPEDRPMIEKQQKKMFDAFSDMVKNGGLNNKEAALEYKKQVEVLHDMANHAQGRYVGIKALESEKATQTLKAKQQDYENHIDAQKKKDFWQMIDPYQKSLDYNPDFYKVYQNGALVGGATGTGTVPVTTDRTTVSITGGKSKTTQTKTTTSKAAAAQKGVVPMQGTIVKGPDGLTYEVSQQYYDYDKIKQNASDGYLDQKGEQAEQQNKHREIIESSPEYIAKPYLDHIIQRIKDYNKDRGLVTGSPGYIPFDGVQDLTKPDNAVTTPLAVKLPNGQYKINATTPEFSALIALSDINGSYAPETRKWLEDADKFGLLKAKANAEVAYKHVMGAVAGMKARAYVDNIRQQMKYRKDQADQDNYLDELYTHNIVQQPLLEPRGKNSVVLAPIKAENSLPVFTLDNGQVKQLQPIGGEPVYANPSDKTKGKKPLYYKGGHYEQQYYFQDKPLSLQEINDRYQSWKSKNKSFTGGIEDFIKGALQTGTIDVKLIGANGATDRKLSLAAQRIITNKNTKKGQVGIFDDNTPPAEDNVPDQPDNNQ